MSIPGFLRVVERVSKVDEATGGILLPTTQQWPNSKRKRKRRCRTSAPQTKTNDDNSSGDDGGDEEVAADADQEEVEPQPSTSAAGKKVRLAKSKKTADRQPAESSKGNRRSKRGKAAEKTTRVEAVLTEEPESQVEPDETKQRLITSQQIDDEIAKISEHLEQSEELDSIFKAMHNLSNPTPNRVEQVQANVQAGGVNANAVLGAPSPNSEPNDGAQDGQGANAPQGPPQEGGANVLPPIDDGDEIIEQGGDLEGDLRVEGNDGLVQQGAMACDYITMCKILFEADL
ncbi:unnamed protein product [Lepeophtheirus salmonis]|uniref:(salmon louse) hypothetical protein n=1 Tax=Lepeophtheirus salmonis TaxID=72036 RepID=A0A817FFK3_LEPSM|nr:unnamed protein product [Lepeophtheirus salmonis]